MNKFLNEFPEEIEAPESDYLFVGPSKIFGAGDGLYTAIEIHTNEIIAIFKGEKLSEAESKTRAERKADGYFVKMLDGTILDSANVECFAKYANDAEGFGKFALRNNAKITLNELDEVCLVASKKILPNQEIFTSYGKKYWDNYLNSNESITKGISNKFK